jgi:2-polyprenyl-3-methyl-5-hydroxy-6-metoxy-1,4-benzoquinol methylase
VLCPLCNSDLVILNSQYNVCHHCELCTSRLPAAGYDGNYYFTSEFRSSDAVARATSLLDLFRQHLSGNKCLDLGCGDGSFVVAAARYGVDCVGVDINASTIAKAKAAGGGRFFCVHELDETFSCVTAFDTIEHFEAPDDFFAAADRYLSPGGHLIVTTPNFGSRWIRIFGNGWHGFGIPQYHRSIFSTRSMSIVLQKHRYRVVTMFSVPPIGKGGWRFLLSSGYRLQSGYLRKLTAFPLATVRFILGSLVASGEDDTLCVVARKLEV